MAEFRADIDLSLPSVEANFDLASTDIDAIFELNAIVSVTKTSQLINDSGFITNEVDDLVNYMPTSNVISLVNDSIEAHNVDEESHPYLLNLIQTEVRDRETEIARVEGLISTGDQAIYDLLDSEYTKTADLPPVYDGVLTIQKNSTNIGTFSANSSSNQTINVEVPTQASDVNALPDTTKYGATLVVTQDPDTFETTITLQDQDGNTLGTPQTVDFPMEDAIVDMSYDSSTKNIVLTFQDTTTKNVSIAPLISGLQAEITQSNKLSADLVDDTNTTHKFVTAADKTNWDSKQPAGDYALRSELPTVNNATLTVQQNGTDIAVFSANASVNQVANITVPTQASDIHAMPDSTTISDLVSDEQQDALDSGITSALVTQIGTNQGDISDINTTIGGYGDIVTHNVSEFATAAQGDLADSALQPNDNVSELVNDAGYITATQGVDAGGTLGQALVKKSDADYDTEWQSADDLRMYNKDAFTVVGSPNITNDGIASGFSNSSFVKIPNIYSQFSNNPWKIKFKGSIKQGTSPINLIGYSWADTAPITIGRMGATDSVQVYVYVLGTQGYIINAYVFSATETDVLEGYIEFTGERYNFYCIKNGDTKNPITTGVDSTDTLKLDTTAGTDLVLGRYNGASTIDLKQFSITVDGVEVFNGSIPLAKRFTSNKGTVTSVNNTTPNASGNVSIFIPTNTSDLTNNSGYITKDVNDLTNYTKTTDLTPVNNATLKIQVNSTDVATFTANASQDVTANIEVPDSATWGNISGTLSNQTDLQDALDDKQDEISDLETIRDGASAGATALQPNDNVSELTNDAGYITSADVGEGILTIQKNGTAVDTFSANASADKTINITVPTKTSDLTNDDGFITGINSTDVTTALGYTPYNATNPSGYITTNDVGKGVLTIQKNSTDVDTFSANASANKTINITVPTKTSDLTNDDGFITGINSTDVTTALGYTPYNATNPSGYITTNDVGKGILTIQKNSTTVDTFSANASDNKTINITVPTQASDINALPDSTTLSDLADTTEQAVLSSGITSSLVTQIGTNESNISDIKDLIPNEATSNNQLADKEFVNSSIATNTANFIGTFSSVPELEAYTGTVTNNDYAFVTNQVVTNNGSDWATFAALDAVSKASFTNYDYAWVINGSNFDLYRFDIVNQEWVVRATNTAKADVTLNTAYNRYKATVASNVVTWDYEYTLNNSSFTAVQWAAINSGATTSKISQIATNAGDILDLQTNKADKTDIPTVVSELTNDSGYITSSAVGNATITIQKNGTNVDSFTTNASVNKSINITVPTKTSDLTNDDGFITGITSSDVTTALGYTPANSASLATVATSGDYDDLTDKPTIGNATITITQGNITKGTFTVNQTSDATINLDAAGSTITIDSAMSDTSENPVQNKVITAALANKQNEISDLSDIRSGASAGATALQPNDNVSELTNDIGYITSSAVGTGVLTIQKNGTAVDTFSANATANKSINISVPTKTSDLTNDDGFITGITSSDVTTALGYTPYNATNPSGYITTNDVGKGVLTIQKNGTTVDTFSANATANKSINISVPTKTSDLANDSGFVAEGDLPTHALKSYLDEGELLTDEEGLNDVIHYAHSTFDESKFTVVGSPIITDNGIFKPSTSSAATATNYVKVPADNTVNHIRVKYRFITGSTYTFVGNQRYLVEGTGQVFLTTQNTEYGFRFTGSGFSDELVNNINLVANKTYDCTFERNGLNVSYTFTNVTDNISTTVTNTLSTMPSTSEMSLYKNWAANIDDDLYFELKYCSVEVDGIPVFSGNKTGVDTIKADDWTTSATPPTISNDGVMQISGTNYYYVVVPNLGTPTGAFKVECVIDRTSGNGAVFPINVAGQVVPFGLFFNGSGGAQWTFNDITLSGTTFSLTPSNQKHYVLWEFDGTSTYHVLLKNIETGITIDERTWTNSNKISHDLGNVRLVTLADNYFLMDLNTLKVYYDGNLVYQPCLKIPYTLSSTGSKIVDQYYVDRVEDTYEQFGSAEYYTLREDYEPNYQIVGSPTISSDYIASGFSSSDYLKLPESVSSSILNSTTFKCVGHFTFINNTTGVQWIFGTYRDRIGFGLVDGYLKFSYNNSDISSTVIPQVNTSYKVEFGYDGTKAFVDVFDENDVLLGHNTLIKEKLTSSFAFYIGLMSTNFPFTGSIDLKSFKVTIDNKKVYYAVIPPNFTLPMGEVYGFITQKADKTELPTKTSDLTNDSGFITSSSVGTGVLTIQKNSTNIDTFSANASANKTINISVPTKTSDITNDSGYITKDVNNLTYYTKTTDLTPVNNATLTIQKNSTTIDTFTANASADKTINITVPTTASDVNALPNTTKYAATITASLNTTTYKLTITLKDQNGDTLGQAQEVDFPCESALVGVAYNSNNKSLTLTTQSGSTSSVDISGLISGLQPEITQSNKLSADLVDDTSTTHKFVTAADITNWNSKQPAGNYITYNGSSAIGSSTKPVYIAQNGTATACGFTVQTNVPANAVFTDTTYSIFTGATSSAAGTSGLVPAPSALEYSKFLKGDGSWDLASKVTFRVWS